MSTLLNSLQLSSFSQLYNADNSTERIECPQCHKKMKYFCYNCRLRLLPNTPCVKLPINLEVIIHPNESNSRSTALTATILSPEQVNWNVYPDIPKYDPNETLLLYPGKDAKNLSEIKDITKYKKVVCVESVWSKANLVSNHPHLKSLQKVVISEEETIFWRYQKVDKTNLATIEAIFYFYRDWFMAVNKTYNHEVDDLLYFYCYNYYKIQSHYKNNPDLSFTHIENYIKYDNHDSGDLTMIEK
ncbi:tRNA-uridine aminocarboxypropyltransferase 1 [Entamoeba marina]